MRNPGMMPLAPQAAAVLTLLLTLAAPAPAPAQVAATGSVMGRVSADYGRPMEGARPGASSSARSCASPSRSGGAFEGFLGVSYFREEGTQRVPWVTDERSLWPLLTGVFHAQSGGQFPVTPMVVNGRPNLVDRLPATIIALNPRPGSGSGAFLASSYTWRSQVFFEEENQSSIEQDAFGLLHLRGGISLFNGRYEMARF